MLWPKDLNKKIRRRVNLADYTSFKIGGSAEFFFEPANPEELQEALAFAKNNRLKVFILGAGSNIIVSDCGLKGLVIRLNSKFFTGAESKKTCITAAAGLKLNRLVLFAKDKGLGGLEFLAGIPGTLGGALMGNAGAWGKSIGELVKEVTVLDYYGKKSLLCAKDLKFTYRKSNLDKYIIISAKLKLKFKDKIKIASKIKEYLLRRAKTQDNKFPNAGSIFKNPGKNFAGLLIDSCGLKGKIKGGAIISKKHANFILNLKRAKSKDVLSLMNLMHNKVKEKFKINLAPEIEIWK